MKKYECKSWSMNDIAHAMKGTDEQGRKIVIPMFQRGKRWKQDRRDAFIDSLLKGYPVGTLLFAEQGDKVYSVIDGLQRSSTISEYILNPTKKENLKPVDDVILDKCREVLFPGNQNSTINKVINDKILNFISTYKTFDEIDVSDIIGCITNEFASTVDFKSIFNDLRQILKNWYSDYKKDFEIIKQTEIPVIIYTGDNIYLNDIFRRINVKGLPLNDYEIYAATWTTEKFVINNNEIVENVIKKYDRLALDDYTIDMYDSDELRKSKRLTIFEFLFGFGKYLINNYEFLNLDVNKQEDEVTAIGFELVDACINNSRRISELSVDIINRKINLNKLERRINESVKFVQESIATICNFRGNQRKNIQYLHPKYFVIALVAFVFREMYDISNLDEKKPTWEKTKVGISNRILHHYIFEILQDNWHEGGIGKTYTAVKERAFAEEITKNNWNSLLNNYFEKGLMIKQTQRFSNPTNADKLLLNCIYADIFTVKDNFSTSYFDIEHIATKEWMKKLISKSNIINGLPVSHISNLCYLPENINRKKKDKTIYEDSTLNVPIEQVEDKYSFTQAQDLNFLYINYQNNDNESLEKNYYNYLLKRFEKQKEKIFKFLGF